MQLTDEMLQAAMSKAVALGIFPKVSTMQDSVKHWDNLKAVLQVALDAAPYERTAPAPPEPPAEGTG